MIVNKPFLPAEVKIDAGALIEEVDFSKISLDEAFRYLEVSATSHALSPLDPRANGSIFVFR